MSDTIEVSIRQGRDYMSPRKRALYCQFQTPDVIRKVANDLVSGVEPGAAGIRHAAVIAQFIKSSIDYDRTGVFPRGTDYLLEQVSSGDCVDQSVLLMSMLEALEFEARYCCYHIHGKSYGHCVVELEIPDNEASAVEVEETLRSPVHLDANLDATVPVAWDTDDYGRWLVIDPTSPLPTGFDRSSAYRVAENEIRWRPSVDIVCFRPIR
jgi:transglutaminase-like putative cysteine protease